MSEYVRDWSNHVRYLIEDQQRRYEEELRYLQPRFVGQTTIPRRVERVTGYTRMEQIELFLSVFDRHPEWRRTPQQAECHDVFLRACAPSIFRESWEAERANVIAMKRWPSTMKQEVGVGMPRRFGKTISTSMFAAAYALAVPNRRIAIFSAGQRQSGDLLKGVKKFFKIIVDSLDPEDLPAFNIVKNSQENFHIEFSDGTVTEVNSFPCSIQIRCIPTPTPNFSFSSKCCVRLPTIAQHFDTCLLIMDSPLHHIAGELVELETGHTGDEEPIACIVIPHNSAEEISNVTTRRKQSDMAQDIGTYFAASDVQRYTLSVVPLDIENPDSSVLYGVWLTNDSRGPMYNNRASELTHTNVSSTLLVFQLNDNGTWATDAAALKTTIAIACDHARHESAWDTAIRSWGTSISQTWLGKLLEGINTLPPSRYD